jgi:hypothetical protein
MTLRTFELSSETAYDLFQDHWDLMLDIINAPLPISTVQQRLHNNTSLQDLLEHGLLSIQENTVYPTAHIYQQSRKESMATFLQRYILPALTAQVFTSSTCTLQSYYLKLSNAQINTLVSHNLATWIQDLGDCASNPLQHTCKRLSFLLIGTSHVYPHLQDPFEQALQHTRAASMQRSNPQEKHLALLSQIDCSADKNRYETMHAYLTHALQTYMPYTCEDTEATYHITYASCWHT